MSPAQDTLSQDTLQRLAAVVESRRPAADGSGGNPQTSYVARLLSQGPDAFLKKIGEEATEVVLAAKDAQHGGNSAAQQQKIVAEMADLWFHCLVALAHYQLQPADVLAELVRREGLGGLDEKALRKAQERAQGQP
ncbi:MAG: phosphoribosyl-ATP diphosphatase [Burkholderiales bacterium]